MNQFDSIMNDFCEIMKISYPRVSGECIFPYTIGVSPYLQRRGYGASDVQSLMSYLIEIGFVRKGGGPPTHLTLTNEGYSYIYRD